MLLADSRVLTEPTLVVLYPLFALCLVAVLLLNVYNVVPVLWLRLRPHRPSATGESVLGDTITLLVPAYREERTLARCLRSIAALEYPREKLEVIVVTEADDVSTTLLAQQLAESSPGGLRIVVVVVEDTGAPAGKPRALNRGLEHATGDIVGVIDAEDIVTPELCTRVRGALSGQGLDAVQGVLDMANDYDGWMNLQFRAEYGYWFNLYIPGAVRAGYPVPFGGTTNFLTRSALATLGGWDEHNLTEDFDLGLRAYLAGMKVGAIPCVTREESPTTFTAWLRQRTRWQRGKLQTFKVLRTRRVRIGKTVHACLTCLVPHTPVFNLGAVLCSVYVMQYGGELPRSYSYFASAMSLWIVWFCALHGYGYLLATRAEAIPKRRLRALLCAVTLPVYWLAQWLAELRAVKQELLERTIFWEKTEHHLRHECADGVYRRTALRNQLGHAGYSVRERCSIRGRSGRRYRVDMYGTRGSCSLVVQSMPSVDQVALEEVRAAAAMAADVEADEVLLLVPRLTEEARALAEQRGIHVLEWEKPDHELRAIAPRLLPAEAIG